MKRITLVISVILALTAVVWVSGQGDLLTGLRAYWPLDEAYSQRYDVHGPYHLLPSGNPTRDEGQVYHAVLFTAITQSLQITTAQVISDSAFTLVLWASVGTECAAGCTIAQSWDDNGHEWRISYEDGLYYADVGEETALEMTTIVIPPDNRFHMIGLTYDPTSTACSLRVDTYVIAGVCPNTPTTTTAGLTIGGMIGRVDEVALWERVLTALEFDYLYNEGLGRPYQAPAADAYYSYTPIIMHGAGETRGLCYAVDCPAGMSCVDGECVEDPIEAIVPIDYESISWQEWAEIFDELLAPIWKMFVDLNMSVEAMRADTCGDFTESDTFIPSSAELEFSETQTTLEKIYNIGLAMGKPVAYLRTMTNAGILGLNYLTLLIGYFVVVFVIIGYVMAYTIGMRLVRGTLDLIKWVYEWIPFKGT